MNQLKILFMKTFLHVGCGFQNKSYLKGFDNDNWKEIRLDIDKNVNPDIVGTLTDMSLVKSRSVDAVYSSHNIEHIYPHEVPIALKEFYRVLKDDGIVVITCPDLQSVCEAVVKDKLLEPLYETPEGHKISPIDILYGWRCIYIHWQAHLSVRVSIFTHSLSTLFFFKI